MFLSCFSYTTTPKNDSLSLNLNFFFILISKIHLIKKSYE